MSFSTIHTLEARGNILLDVLKNRYQVPEPSMRRLIWQEAERLSNLLDRKGVRYAELNSALVPHVKKNEVALFFDQASIDSAAYGWHVHAAIIPLLNRASSHSILHGDLAAADREWIRTALEIHLEPSGNPFSIVSSNQIFCVYLNNVSSNLRRMLHEALKRYRPYIGLADTTYASQFKAYLSRTLVAAYVKHGAVVLQRHPDCDSPLPSENAWGYPFEAAGLTCRSVPDSYYGVFLSYKIERPVLSEDEVDTRFSTNVISDTPADPASCALEIESAKLEYLTIAKAGTLRRLRVLGAPKATLEQLIQAKLASNYLYDLSYSEALNVGKFNIVLGLEPLGGGEPFRTLAAFELVALANRIRLITFF
jgi:hypothetical protein